MDAVQLFKSFIGEIFYFSIDMYNAVLSSSFGGVVATNKMSVFNKEKPLKSRQFILDPPLWMRIAELKSARHAP